MRVGILIFDDVEELDFVGPLEVFGVAARLSGSLQVVTVSRSGEPIRARYGLHVTPDCSFDTCPPLDLLVVPGGRGAREHVRFDEGTLAFVRNHAAHAEVASVCTGALILAAAGVLRGRRATTHQTALELLRQYPDVRVAEGVRFTRDRGVWTSGGISAGIDLALDLVRERLGDEIARYAERTLEYPPPHQVRTRRRSAERVRRPRTRPPVG
jgi:transcriptional regulator GlxA family with amidase domain